MGSRCTCGALHKSTAQKTMVTFKGSVWLNYNQENKEYEGEWVGLLGDSTRMYVLVQPRFGPVDMEFSRALKGTPGNLTIQSSLDYRS